MVCHQLTMLKRSSSKPRSKHQQTQNMTVHIHWREPVSWTLEHSVLNSRRLPASGLDSKHLPTLWLRLLSAQYQGKWFLHFKDLKMAHFRSKHVAAQLDTYTTLSDKDWYCFTYPYQREHYMSSHNPWKLSNVFQVQHPKIVHSVHKVHMSLCIHFRVLV